ncbi:MAG: TerC family protein [Chloroflexi bacterium]|nr:TerC family protein [Chloroflexota bacterium]
MNWTWIADPETWIALVTLVALELVLGVDNVIFISILSGKLPPKDQPRARSTGIMLAVITRILLLLSLSWIISLEETLFTLPLLNVGISGRDLVLLAGGLFLLWKSTREIHDKLEGEQGHASAKVAASFASVIIQIMLLDIVFSLDSVITAVGMVDHIEIMIIAVVLAAGVMVFTAGPIAGFVEKHPTIKILALSFLLLIGFTLVVEGLHQHIPKGYIYFAMAFSVFVEILNLRVRAKSAPVNLREAYSAETTHAGQLTPVPVTVEIAAPAAMAVSAPEAKPARKSVRKTNVKPKTTIDKKKKK